MKKLLWLSSLILSVCSLNANAISVKELEEKKEELYKMVGEVEPDNLVIVVCEENYSLPIGEAKQDCKLSEYTLTREADALSGVEYRSKYNHTYIKKSYKAKLESGDDYFEKDISEVISGYNLSIRPYNDKILEVSYFENVLLELQEFEISPTTTIQKPIEKEINVDIIVKKGNPTIINQDNSIVFMYWN